MLDRRVINVAPFGSAVFRQDLIGSSKNNFYLMDNAKIGFENEIIVRSGFTQMINSDDESLPFVKNGWDNAAYGGWYADNLFLVGLFDGSAATAECKIYSVDFDVNKMTLINTVSDASISLGLNYDGCNFSFIQDASNIYFVCGDNKYRTWDKNVGSPTITAYTSGVLAGLDRFECIEEFDKRPFLVPMASKNLIVWGNDIDNWTDFSNTDNFEYIGDATERIVNIVSWGGYLIIFKERSIYLLSGNADQGYSLQKISGNFGAFGKHHIDKSDDGVYFISSDRRLMVFTGGQFTEIPIFNYIIKNVLEFQLRRFFKLRIIDRKIYVIFQNGMTGYNGCVYVFDLEKKFWYRLITNGDNSLNNPVVIPQRVLDMWTFPYNPLAKAILLIMQDYSFAMYHIDAEVVYSSDIIYGFNKTTELLQTSTLGYPISFDVLVDVTTQKLPGTGVEDEFRKRFRRVFLDIEGRLDRLHMVYSVDGTVKDYKLSSEVKSSRIQKWIRLDNPVGQNIMIKIKGRPTTDFAIRKIQVEYDIISIRRYESDVIVSTDYDDPF